MCWLGLLFKAYDGDMEKVKTTSSWAQGILGMTNTSEHLLRQELHVCWLTSFPCQFIFNSLSDGMLGMRWCHCYRPTNQDVPIGSGHHLLPKCCFTLYVNLRYSEKFQRRLKVHNQVNKNIVKACILLLRNNITKGCLCVHISLSPFLSLSVFVRVYVYMHITVWVCIVHTQ